jgi:hypothetical protein
MLRCTLFAIGFPTFYFMVAGMTSSNDWIRFLFLLLRTLTKCVSWSAYDSTWYCSTYGMHLVHRIVLYRYLFSSKSQQNFAGHHNKARCIGALPWRMQTRIQKYCLVHGTRYQVTKVASSCIIRRLQVVSTLATTTVSRMSSSVSTW